MIVRIFKISTAEMWTLKNKQELLRFIKQEINMIASSNLTIQKLTSYFPVEEYHIVTSKERR